MGDPVLKFQKDTVTDDERLFNEMGAQVGASLSEEMRRLVRYQNLAHGVLQELHNEGAKEIGPLGQLTLRHHDGVLH